MGYPAGQSRGATAGAPCAFVDIVWAGPRGERGKSSHTLVTCRCTWRGTPLRPETLPLSAQLAEWRAHVAATTGTHVSDH